jgi:hypothetical protein
VKIFKIFGKPWEHDLAVPSPFPVMVIEIYGKSVLQNPPTEHQLYKLFRPYGKLSYISIEDRSMKDGKPFLIRLRYRKISSAIAARVCLHGGNYYALSGTQTEQIIADKSGDMVVNYQPFEARNFINSYAKNHPRIFAVVVGIIVLIMTYTIIDPIRAFFVWRKLVSSTHQETALKYYSKGLLKLLGLSVLLRPSVNEEEIRLIYAEERIQQYLKRAPDSILYITGANGTGKSTLARKALQEYQPSNSLLLDFEELLQAADEETFVREFAQKIGFRPGFRVMELVGSILDAITPGAGKATFLTAAGKVQQILNTLTTVIQQVGESDKGPIPLIIIDGFTDMTQTKHTVFLNSIMNTLDLWARFKLARVIFVGDSNFDALGGLASMVPNAKVEKLFLSDLASREITEKLIQSKISWMGEEFLHSEEMREAIHILGGRMSDLGLFLNRIQSGQSPMEAVESIVDNAKDELKNILLGHKKPSKEYTTVQFWKMILLFSEKSDVPYDYPLFNIFKGDDKALRSLIQTKLFAMVQDEQLNERILPGSPIIKKAFEKISHDQTLRAGMDMSVAAASMNSEEKNINACEQELVLLQTAGLTQKPSSTILKRIQYLISKIEISQDKISKYDAIVKANEEFLKSAHQL